MRITSESSRIFPLHSYTAALRATWDLIDASSTHPRLHKIWVSTGGVHGSPHHSPPTAHRQSSRRRAQHSSGDAAHASGEATTHRDYTHRNPVKTPPMCVTGGATTHRLPTEIHSRDAAHVSQVEPPPTDSPRNNTAKMPPMCHRWSHHPQTPHRITQPRCRPCVTQVELLATVARARHQPCGAHGSSGWRIPDR